MEITPWHSVTAGIIMFHILLLLITRLESLATVLPGLDEKCVKLSVLQMNLQESLLKHFLYLLPYCLQYSDNILDCFGHVHSGSHTNTDWVFSWKTH